MKDKLFSLFAAIAMAGTMAAAQDRQAPTTSPYPASPSLPQSSSTTSPTTQTEDESLTGCLVQGSGPSVFLLENAKITAEVRAMKPSTATDQPGSAASSRSDAKTYVVTVSAVSVDLKGQINHQVTITGTGEPAVVSAPASPPSARMNEKDLPKFTARTVTKIADTCSNAG